MKMIRLAVATAGVVSVALLLVAAASAKPPAPPTNVACSQQALVDAINAANSAGGGTLNLAHGCDYQLTSSPDDSENGLPRSPPAIKINGNGATIDGTDSFRDFEVDGPGGNLSAHDLTITGGSARATSAAGSRTRRHGDAGSQPGDRQQRGCWPAAASPAPRSTRRASRRSRAPQLGERQPADRRRPGDGGFGRGRDPQRHRHREAGPQPGERQHRRRDSSAAGSPAATTSARSSEQCADPQPQPGERQHRAQRRRRRHPEPARDRHRQPQPGQRQHVAERRRHLQRSNDGIPPGTATHR